MKKIICLMLILTTLVFSACEKDVPDKETEKNKEPAPLAQSAILYDGEENVIGYYSYEYNKDDLMTKLSYFTAEKKLDWYYVYKYDGEKIIEQTQYSAHGAVMISFTYTYDGDVCTVYTDYADKNMVNTTHKEYYEDGLLEKAVYSDEEYEKCTYSGDLLKKSTLYYLDEVIRVWDYDYEDELLTKLSFINGDGEIEYYYTYEYDGSFLEYEYEKNVDGTVETKIHYSTEPLN